MSGLSGQRGGPPQESAYPPPPGEEDDRPPRPQYQQLPPPAGMTLPPIQDSLQAYSSRYPDPRAQGNYTASPTAPNGYGPPGPSYQLPPVQPPHDHRYSGDQHRPFYDARGGSYPPPPPQPDQYNYTYRPSSGPPYNNGSYVSEYGRGVASAAGQAAPRQRTSIACSYCRRRKIRCSGYGTSDGVCSNCRKTGNKCVFQPVSSSSTTAFVPVSAVPGGVPPGTPLYGAFGQPLPQGAAAGGPPGPGGAPLPPPPGGAQPYPPQPQQSEGYGDHSPRASYYPPPPDDGNSRRRLHEEDHTSRLPPPNPYGEPDPRRRSPASPIQGGTPPQGQYDYPTSTRSYDPGERTGTPRHDTPTSPQHGGNGLINLTSLMDQHPPPRPPAGADSSHDIDQTMLGRLNRRS
ncbi:hypothetical protein M406DRAFT_343579 [Cryphonectria parasitica EP155]|uniref:Zn(2)-C6 fungal-type domain-containing protein n=1 Tax=Cryphonectria parasitica (strain ATCC 38755 / EP155) TaxID=660469 RepID=A0A9P4XS31_CRYP1|nr:uncharacterized protein M406DRAFT_343579 [Cryphonectria parasitica EP155]KAF3759938.1 hypothetical protein M406DRAFT_343579 [Cryphonectria parasitica EP155]